MLNTLNDFELAILNRIAGKYSFLHSHIPFLSVDERKTTGVGIYVDFSYNRCEGYDLIPANFIALSGNDALHIEGLTNELSYEVAVTNGQLDFLEVVTNGNEMWDGTIGDFWFDR
jgi:hypothetical protein